MKEYLSVVLYNCAAGIREFVDGVDETENLPFVLDDLGCSGSESNLLECLPSHNCLHSADEDAAVRCSRKGGADYYIVILVSV